MRARLAQASVPGFGQPESRSSREQGEADHGLPVRRIPCPIPRPRQASEIVEEHCLPYPAETPQCEALIRATSRQPLQEHLKRVPFVLATRQLRRCRACAGGVGIENRIHRRRVTNYIAVFRTDIHAYKTLASVELKGFEVEEMVCATPCSVHHRSKSGIGYAEAMTTSIDFGVGRFASEPTPAKPASAASDVDLADLIAYESASGGSIEAV